MLLLKNKGIAVKLKKINRDKHKKNNSKIKSTILLILLITSTIVTLPILHPTSVSAVNIADNQDMQWQIQSMMYYETITKCMESAALADSSMAALNMLSADNAKSGQWFKKGTTEWMGVYMRDTPTSSDPMEIGSDGIVGCENPELVNNALEHWGLEDSKLRILCKSGLARTNQGDLENQALEDCEDPNGTDSFVSALSSKIIASRFKNYIREVVYNSKDPTLTDAQLYMFYRHSLNESCIEGLDSTEPDDVERSDSNKKAYNNVNWVYVKEDGTVDMKTGNYLGSLDYQTYTHLRIDEGMTCYNTKEKMNSYAAAFLEWAEAHPTEAKVEIENATNTVLTSENTPTCGSEVPALGWLICPMISGLSAMNDGMWSLVSNLLKTDPLKQSDNIYSAWGVIRNLANIAFVVAFLIIIFSQLSNIGVSNYGIKKLLPKIIISAILVNLSFIIVQIAVDLANIVGSSLYNVLVGLLGKADPPTYVVFFDLLLAGLAGGAGFTASTIIIAGGASTLFWMMLPILLIAALGFLAALFTLGFRSAAIPILAILSPLAFVAYLLPNTESWFKKWRDMFIKMLMLYPLAALVFGGAVFASSAIIGKDNLNWWNYLIGLIVMALPLFSLPFLAAKGGDILSKANGAFMGLANKAKSPIGKWTGRHGGLANSRANNSAINDDRLNKNGRPKSRRTRYLQRRARFDAINKNQQNEYGRAQSDYIANQAESNTSFRQKLSGGAGEAGQQRALASAISVQNKLESDEVSAAKIVFKHADLNGNDIQELALKGKLRLAGENGTIKTYSGKAMQRAAIEEKMSAGSMDEIHKIIGESGESLSEFRGVIATGMVTNKLSTKDPSLGGKRIDDTGKGEIKGFKGMHKVRLEAIKQGKYTSEALATMDDKAREEAIYSAEYENTNNNNSAYLEILKNAASGIIGTETTPGYLELQNKIKGNNLATAQINDLANSNSRTSKMEEKEIKQRNEQLK